MNGRGLSKSALAILSIMGAAAAAAILMTFARVKFKREQGKLFVELKHQKTAAKLLLHTKAFISAN
jgi:hypothetical protein